MRQYQHIEFVKTHAGQVPGCNACGWVMKSLVKQVPRMPHAITGGSVQGQEDFRGSDPLYIRATKVSPFVDEPRVGRQHVQAVLPGRLADRLVNVIRVFTYEDDK